MIYERCLEERNSIISSLALNPLELTSPSEGTFANVGTNGTQVTPVIPECDLEKELDNVNTSTKQPIVLCTQSPRSVDTIWLADVLFVQNHEV
jgi:hypothetical protein